VFLKIIFFNRDMGLTILVVATEKLEQNFSPSTALILAKSATFKFLNNPFTDLHRPPR